MRWDTASHGGPSPAPRHGLNMVSFRPQLPACLMLLQRHVISVQQCHTIIWLIQAGRSTTSFLMASYLKGLKSANKSWAAGLPCAVLGPPETLQAAAPAVQSLAAAAKAPKLLSLRAGPAPPPELSLQGQVSSGGAGAPQAMAVTNGAVRSSVAGERS